MNYIDFLLNGVGLLLWINWRSLGFVTPPSALSLVSAIKPTERERGGRWIFLACLPALLLFRSLFYWQMGPSLEWTPKLYFGVYVVSIHGETFGRFFLYSLFSFGIALAAFYAWLFLLAAINRNLQEPDPWHKLVRLHLGWFARLPVMAQLLLPFVLIAALWPVVHWIFFQLGLAPAARGDWEMVRECALVSLSVLLAWKWLVVPLLLLYFLNTYIYFGASSIWRFIAFTGRNLLVLLRWAHFGRFDLAPLIGIAILLGISEGITRWPQWWPAFMEFLKSRGIL